MEKTLFLLFKSAGQIGFKSGDRTHLVIKSFLNKIKLSGNYPKQLQFTIKKGVLLILILI